MTFATSIPPITVTLNHSTIRDIERASIRSFVESCSEVFTGTVLDYGCGQQPYADFVMRAGGIYVPFDRVEFPANVSGRDVGDLDEFVNDFDAILCTQVIQYVERPADFMAWFRRRLAAKRGHLVLTYPTCWSEVEPEDLHRFTRTGIDRLLQAAGFEVLRNERRAEVDVGGFSFPLGGGALARA